MRRGRDDEALQRHLHALELELGGQGVHVADGILPHPLSPIRLLPAGTREMPPRLRLARRRAPLWPPGSPTRTLAGSTPARRMPLRCRWATAFARGSATR